MLERVVEKGGAGLEREVESDLTESLHRLRAGGFMQRYDYAAGAMCARNYSFVPGQASTRGVHT